MVAGEPSGDALGARLMTALKQAGGGPIRFAGVGGPLMEAEGLASLFPMGELAVMGLVEILPHAPRLLRRLGQTAAEICRLEPDAVVTIDSPGFSFRLAQRLRGSRILHVHYVAPQLWAWRPERGKKIAQRIDHLMALLPFEPAFFEVFGLACSAWHCLFGAGPFGNVPDRADLSSAVLVLVERARAGEVGSPAHLPKGMPPHVIEVLRAAFEPDPTRRPTLRRWLADLELVRTKPRSVHGWLRLLARRDARP